MLMSIRKALHTRDDIDRLYVSRKEGRRGLTSIEDCIKEPVNYIKICRERLITAMAAQLQTEKQ